MSPQAAILELIGAVNALRKEARAADQAVIDTALNTIVAGGKEEKGSIRKALSTVASVAAMVGQVGVPVIESVRKVTEALGL